MADDLRVPFGDQRAISRQIQARPLSLSPDEVGNDTPRRLSPPIPVTVWVHYLTPSGIRAVKLPGEADGHTSRAVHVRGTLDSHGWACWVWANAVTRIHPKVAKNTAPPAARQPVVT